MSYVIRRVWDVEPREARKAATLLAEMGRIYEEHERRGPTTVYFNGGTLPGERNQVYMQWDADTIDSPYGTGQPSIDEMQPLSAKLREITSNSRIEFYEKMTPAKAMEI